MNYIDKFLFVSVWMDRVGEVWRGWMFEWLKELVLKIEVFIEILGVWIFFYLWGYKFFFVLFIDKNELDWFDWYDRWNGSLCFI